MAEMTNADLFLRVFGIYATELWAMPEQQLLEWLNAPCNRERLKDMLSAQLNNAHNEGYDVGYWAGRRDYEQKWIPVTEGLPENFEEVNITWVNHDPEQYYAGIKDVPFVASGVFYKGRWYWWSARCADYLREYGNSPNDIMDDSIEVVAWKPMSEPYKEER